MMTVVGLTGGIGSGKSLVAADWAGKGSEFGAIVPVAQTFMVSGAGGGWLRESFELQSEPPTAEESQRFQTTRRLQLEGR